MSYTMNIEKKSKIDEIVNGSPSRLRETYIKTNYYTIYDEIIRYCKKISDLPFVQKVWHWVNDTPIYVKCSCGNNVSFNRNWLDGYRYGCSPKCTQQNSLTKEKRKRTNIEKYGVDNISKLQESKDKQEQTNIKKYGTKSSAQNEIVKSKTISTNRKRYGVDYTFQDDSVKEKIKQTMLERYGVDNYRKTKEYEDKNRSTNLKKYGKEWYTQTEEYIQKTINTNLKKYGKEWYTQTDYFKNLMTSIKSDVITKMISTNRERYGTDWYSQTSNFKQSILEYQNTVNISELVDRMIETNLSKYGKKWYTQTEEYSERTKKTNISKYGKEYFFQTESLINHNKEISKSKERRDINIKISNEKYYNNLGFTLLKSNKDEITLLSNSCNHTFTCLRDTFYKRISTDVNGCIVCYSPNTGVSSKEMDIRDWISELNINYKTNERLLDRHEIDIYITDKKIGIEFNGLYWHSELNKPNKDYHLNKTMMSSERGISLLHIWEDDWLYKQEIVKSIIKNRVGKIDNRIYARSCKVGLVTSKDTRQFLDENHIQGYCTSKINIGLYYKDELISLMTFGNRQINSSEEFELLRFCNKINHSIIGSASKLFKHFISNYSFSQITSYADISMFDGDLYKTLGFDFIHRTEPNYWWVVDGVRRHRFNFNKKRLVKMGADPNKTESEIMYDLGYYKIWGCGMDKYIYYKK